jgi:hypothetical protein
LALSAAIGCYIGRSVAGLNHQNDVISVMPPTRIELVHAV